MIKLLSSLALMYFIFSASIAPVQITTSNQASVLSDGQLFAIEISETGVHELTGEWLIQNFGSAFENTSLDMIHIYGIEGGTLNENSTYNSTERLTQIPLQVIGSGNLESQDKIFFYAENADKWIRNENGIFDFIKNPYASSSRYFVKIGSEEQLEIPKESTTAPTDLSNEYRHLEIYHEDEANLLGVEVSNQGSGQDWYGPNISNENNGINLNRFFTSGYPDLESALITIRLAGRSSSSETVTIQIGTQSNQRGISAVNTGDVEELYARIADLSLEALDLTSTDNISFEKTRNNPDAKMWIDFIQIEGISKIPNQNGAFFNNSQVIQEQKDGILIENYSDEIIWDISESLRPFAKEASPISSNNSAISSSNSLYSNYVIFDASQTQKIPEAIGQLPNQNICNVDAVDLLIIYPDILESAALKLKNHRSEYSNLDVIAIPLQDILNAYSAGRMDPTAIRNYIRELYNIGTGIQHVLLLGDASYDYRNIRVELANENLIPTYETKESLDPLLAFPSDDYFALLDDDEGGNLRGELDVSVGRLTVRNPSEAQIVVDKIIKYDLSSATSGPWKSNITFMADDEDNNLHLKDADRIAREVEAKYPLFNQSKIYLDAFVQESTPGGNRYPSATESLNRSVNRGSLVLNYLGHGGPRGWCQERVLKIDDINSWTNADRLPLVITATCSFTGFDDPALTTAGESVLLQPNGGGVALFTTVRSVYASKNFRLTQAVFRNIFEQENGNYLSIGEIMRRSKNDIPNDNTNARKFFLIGDPSMHLAIPNYNIETTAINGRTADTSDLVVDTVGALDLVTITGEIQDPIGILADDFDGVIDVTVFDKPSEVSTLGNDNTSFITEYESQENIIYQGKATVEDGIFSIEFRVPRDIDYDLGQAKISYYAKGNNNIEALGANQQLLIVGTSEENIDDNEGPEINIYLNTRSFQSGDVVGPNNLVIVDLQDENGINLSNAAIGHEMIGILDNDERTILNPFYEPSLSDGGAGVITYDLSGLEPGEHKLLVKAFDVLNNPGQSEISFIVDENISYPINDVIISPNPFSDRVNISMNSDIRASVVTMEIQIFNSLGQLIGTESEIASFDNETYSADFSINSASGHARFLFLLITLNDESNSVQSESVLKKVLSLK